MFLVQAWPWKVVVCTFAYAYQAVQSPPQKVGGGGYDHDTGRVIFITNGKNGDISLVERLANEDGRQGEDDHQFLINSQCSALPTSYVNANSTTITR